MTLKVALPLGISAALNELLMVAMPAVTDEAKTGDGGRGTAKKAKQARLAKQHHEVIIAVYKWDYH